jgi:hypothetical protein
MGPRKHGPQMLLRFLMSLYEISQIQLAGLMSGLRQPPTLPSQHRRVTSYLRCPAMKSSTARLKAIAAIVPSRGTAKKSRPCRRFAGPRNYNSRRLIISKCPRTGEVRLAENEPSISKPAGHTRTRTALLLFGCLFLADPEATLASRRVPLLGCSCRANLWPGGLSLTLSRVVRPTNDKRVISYGANRLLRAGRDRLETCHIHSASSVMSVWQWTLWLTLTFCNQVLAERA